MTKKIAVLVSLMVVLTASGCRQRNVVRNQEETVKTKVFTTQGTPATKLQTESEDKGITKGTTAPEKITSPSKITRSDYNGQPITVPFMDPETTSVRETKAIETTVPSTTVPVTTIPPEKKKINTAAQVKVYASSQDAKSGKGAVTTYSPGEYFIFSEENGMINLTKNKEVQGGWVNPSDLVTGERDKEGNMKTKIYIPVSINIYNTSYDAANKSKKVTTWDAGEYFVYTEDQGMFNITIDPNTPAGWMNPEETGIKISTVPDDKKPQKETTKAEAETIEINKNVPVYASSKDAQEKKNSISEYPSGKYFIFKKENGMINISKNSGTAGAWFNPESIGQKPETTTTTDSETTTKKETTKPETTTEKESVTEKETTTEKPTTTKAMTSTKPVSTMASYEGKKIIIKNKISVYKNADDARNRENSVNEYPSGEYFFYKEEGGMVNITDEEGSAGAWINPSDGIEAKDLPRTTTKPEPSTTTEKETTTEKPATTTTKAVNTMASYKGKKILIKDKISVYGTAEDARNRENAVNEYPSGEYFFYKEEDGMVNITDEEGSAGAWINPSDGIDAKDMPKTTTKAEQDLTTETTVEKITTTEVNTTSETNLSVSYKGKKLILEKRLPVYGTASDAENGENPVNDYPEGEYFVYKEENGMVNITDVEGAAGAWINPSEGIKVKNNGTSEETKPDSKKTTTKTESTKTNETKPQNEEITVGNKITLTENTDVYSTADAAVNPDNSAITYIPGEYYVYKITDTAINISREKGSAGGWIKKDNPGLKSTAANDAGEEGEVSIIDAGFKTKNPSGWNKAVVSETSAVMGNENVTLSMETQPLPEGSAAEYINEITGEKGKRLKSVTGATEGAYYESNDGTLSYYVYKLKDKMFVIKITSETKLSADDKKKVKDIINSVRFSD